MSFDAGTEFGVVECTLNNGLMAVAFGKDSGPPRKALLSKAASSSDVKHYVLSVSHGAKILATESPPAMALLRDRDEAATPDEAYEGAEAKLRDSLAAVNHVLLGLRSRTPRGLSWIVRPISLWEIGVAHHTAEHFCTNTQPNSWVDCRYYPIMSIARQLNAPLLHVDISGIDWPSVVEEGPQCGLYDTLLDEAFAFLFTGSPRLSVMNAVAAIELLANTYFMDSAIRALRADGLKPDDAERAAEAERKRHRTDFAYLLHKGPKKHGAPSLLAESKELYDGVLRDQETRHGVAHRGESIHVDEALNLLKRACSVVRWLEGRLGLPVRPFSAFLSGFSAGAPG